MTTVIRVKGWDKFQHFKDRRPPWIKLYRDILDDIEWHELDPVAAKCLVMLWLIASENDGELPDVRKLSFRLRMSETDILNVVSKLSHWLEHGDITVISERYHDDLPEKRQRREETETETEGEKKAARTRDVFTRPDDVSESVWADYLKLRKAKRAPVTETVLNDVRKEAAKAGMSLEDALRLCCAKGWQGFDAAWVKADAKPKGAQQSQHAFYGKVI